MIRVAWWGVVSSALAPVLLVGGWTLAAARQAAEFSSVRDSISSLAGLGAADRWLMTAAFVGTGICHLVTACALRPAARPGRLVLAAGGLATVGLAAVPVPVVGTSASHGLMAAVALGALAVWPALAWRRGPDVPWGLRPRPALGAALGLLLLLGWFGAQLASDGGAIGLTERFAAGAQALWPLVVVGSARVGAGRP